MPLTQKITIQNGTIGVWNLKETADDLLKICKLNPSDTGRLESFKAEKRRKEFLASRLLLQTLLPQCPEIIYQEKSGKPSLNNSNLNISITHSANLAAIILSEKSIGIDIEQLDRNIDKVVTRFANPSEISFIEKSNDPQLLKILLWSAKEAIFKCSGIQGVQFNEHINIASFDYSAQPHFNGSLSHATGKFYYDLFFRIIENNVLVYCVQH
ncbi:4'-phosphopantetheinyl transferase family protein [Draconibacterium halophilum]|uniref:4'-phosphopantetheinyl transferase superfamily protein n=1 Tax=Draconibacterium halophilum TaxID=2706887 RepID=A0A6C0RIJ4_9BACT|nr:4'-phosphopantetheinyl transferase superfamily protein [Draconibacterium halophilum]QIA08961.1 4'-phosphopantetheinyl transferase superfamily protein [Draconibacterium halophilum]